MIRVLHHDILFQQRERHNALLSQMDLQLGAKK
jgi:hypothetical protein